MKKIISVFCAVVLLISSFSFSVFALTEVDADAELERQNVAFNNVIKDKLDVDGSGRMDAADARATLLISAGLTEDGVNVDNADIDGDGTITAIDARIFLRIAAKLENIDQFIPMQAKYDYFKAIINSIKPNKYKYYRSTIDSTDAVNYRDNNNVIGEMNRQMDLYSRYDSTMESFDLGEELKASVNEKSASYSNSDTAKITNSIYPVAQNELAFFVDLKDVEKIEHKTNQTYTYTRYTTGNFSKVAYSESVTGLDSFTLYLKDDNKLDISNNIDGLFDNLIVSKAFDILSEADIERVATDYANASDIGGMEGMGTFESKMTPKDLEYYDSVITVYYNPETGIPVGTTHMLKYKLNLNMYMNIDISVDDMIDNMGSGSGVIDTGLKVFLEMMTLQNRGKLLYLKGSIDLFNEMSSTKSFYFYENHNQPHISYRDAISNNS